MIRTERHDDIAVLHMEHGKVNAIDLELFVRLDELLGELLVSDDAPRALVLTGRGSAFSAGVDLFRVLDAGEDAEGGEAYGTAFLGQLDRTLRRVFTLPVPVIAAINGHAIAGGCVLAAACDRRLMADGKGRIGVSELKVGVPFPVTALEVLRSLLSPRTLQDLVLTGRLLDVHEALAAGLVDEVVPEGELLERALKQARSLARVPATSYAVTKRLLRQPTVERIERYTETFDPEVQGIWASDAIHGAIRGFLQKTVGKK